MMPLKIYLRMLYRSLLFTLESIELFTLDVVRSQLNDNRHKMYEEMWKQKAEAKRNIKRYLARTGVDIYDRKTNRKI